jgi:multidrug resistance efflux pump
MHAEALAKATATVAKARERLTYAGAYLESAKLLFEEKLLSKQDTDKAREEVAVRQRELEEADAELKRIQADDLAEVKQLAAVAGKEATEAQGNLALLLAGSRPEEIEVTRAELASEEARRRHIREQLELMRVASPISGVITTPKLKQRIGQLVSKGDLIATVHELKTVTAEIMSPEKEIADVRVGQKVVLKARAYPGETFVGTVASIAPIAIQPQEQPDARSVLVSCQIDNPSLLLKAEMTGRAKIYCGKRRIIDVLSRRISRYVRIEFWSWW